jgi:HPt (histidine-containing phosphotransfer) domain-containing protein
MDDGPGHTDPEVLDTEALESLADQLDDGFAGLIERFRRRLEETPTAIRAACAAGERETLVREAHSLKSVAATFGAPVVSRTSAELEAAGADASNDDVEALVARLERDCEAAGAALRRAGI